MNATTAPTPAAARAPRKWLHSVFGICCLVLLLAVHLAGGMPFGLIYDPNRLHCLTDFHLGVFLRHHPTQFARSDLVMFKPVPALSYVREPYVLKRVAGVPGDHLVITGQSVIVNGHELVRGLELANLYKVTPEQLQRDEQVPPGKLFVVGNAVNSDDSRYWGYLDESDVVGTARRLF